MLHPNQPNAQQSNNTQLKSLAMISQDCRNSVVEMLTAAKSSHLGCSFSIIDILVVLYHHIVDLSLIKQQSPNRDYIILSKGHAASGLYAVLASAGFIDKSLLQNYHKSFLAGHPIRTLQHGIEASTGSLGHGPSMGVGIAIAAKNDGRNCQIYVIVGDGECQSGAIWEALMVAARYNLNNLTIIVDHNNLQALARTQDIMTGTFEEKFLAFGCSVHHVDGHNHQDIIDALESSKKIQKPHVIIAKTIKGKGLSFIEDKLEWHYRSLQQDQYVLAKQELKQS